MDGTRKVKNPLLSAAGQGYSYDYFTGNALLVPVTPATPAILSGDNDPPKGEVDTFLGQSSAGATLGPIENVPVPLAEEVKDPTPSQPQKQSYFTSILSSLSLTSNKSESPQTSTYQETSVSTINFPHGGQANSQQSNLPTSYTPLYPIGSLPPRVSQEVNLSTPPLQASSLQAPPLQPPPLQAPPLQAFPLQAPPLQAPPLQVPPQQAPPLQVPPLQGPPLQRPPVSSLPPSGGSGSYRLGNQRRLKYAPPPDLTSTPVKHQQPSVDPIFPSYQNPPSVQSLLIPGALSQISENQSSSNPPLSGSPSPAPTSSRQDSFRSSPINTSSHSLSQPQTIPSRVPEPATPQNTPANFSFSGFSHYRPTSQPPTVNNNINSYFNNVNTTASQQNSEQTFAPISAEQVTEKLEHLIAERKEDTVSKESASVSRRNADDLAEVDLNSANQYLDNNYSSVGFINPHQSSLPVTHNSGSINFHQPTLTNYFSGQKNYSNNENLPQGNTLFNSEQVYEPIGEQFSTIEQQLNIEKQEDSNQKTDLVGTSVEEKEKPANILDKIYSKTKSIDQVRQDIKPAETIPSVRGFFDDEPSQNKSDLTFSPIDFANPPAPQQYLSANSSYEPVPHFYSGHSKDTYLTGPQIFQSHQPATLDVQTENLMVTPVLEPTGAAILNPSQMSVNSYSNRTSPDTVPPSLKNLATSASERRMQYRPVYHHWFYRKEIESKTVWRPFSMQDSFKLEEIHNSTDISPETRVATDGGRYDVDILRRQRSPVYWSEAPNEVRRCSWFHKGATESRYFPYEENTAARLEEEYKQACSNNLWNKKVELSNGEHIILHSPTLQVHYLQPSTPDLGTSWGTSVGTVGRPRMVKRGVDEFHIEDGEPEKVDHLLFLVHGIGSVCDLKFRTVEEVVDEFRSISLQLVQSHYRTSHEHGMVNRIEVLPISWHATLHSEDTGIDNKLKAITLDSIPKLRHFTNDTLLDILFYTSPIFCQTIMQTVGQELNRLFTLFNERNPEFKGGIYLGGHSLGSLILFDLLCHQHPPAENKVSPDEENEDEFVNNDSDNLGPMKQLAVPIVKRKLSRRVSYVMGAAGTGQPFINYPQLNFHPKAFFALGSPIGMFVTVRGIDTLGENFALPTCPAFFNIFHPFDPVAYRIESLINPEAHKYRPMLIPHHKGRKRMHLELKETMARVGADLKQKLLDSVRSTWNSVYQLAMFHKPDNQTLEQEIDKVVEEQLKNPPSNLEQQNDDGGADLKIGQLNGGRRIDYVLQEAPFEYINEYIFALTSHVCYWESEDTMLMMLKEIYGSMGIQTDAQLPQQSLSIERPSTPSSSSLQSFTATSDLNSPVLVTDSVTSIGTAVIGPPPTSGFVRKSTNQSKNPEFPAA